MKLNRFILFPVISSSLVILLGATVIFGWFTQNTSLVQINPAFAPMQFNTALCFCLCGLAALFSVLKKTKSAIAVATGALVISTLTLCQYIFKVDLGLDMLFVDQAIMTKTSHPGRMSPNTAICFILVGTVFILNALAKVMPLRLGLAMAVLVIAALSVVGYLVGIEAMYGWGNLTRMAIHTATGFIILSACLLFREISVIDKGRFDLWRLSPSWGAASILALTMFVWYAVSEANNARNLSYFNRLVNETQYALNQKYNLYEQSLWAGLGVFYASQSVEREEWTAFVKAFNVDDNLPGINGLGYIDYVHARDMPSYVQRTRQDDMPDFDTHPETFYPDKFIIRFIEPLDRNIQAVGLDIGFEANRRAAAERARDLGVPALTKKITLVQDSKKEAGFLLLIPVYAQKYTPDTIDERRAHFLGWVYAPFIGSNFLRGLEKTSREEISFAVYDGRKAVPEALIYADVGFDQSVDHSYSRKTLVSIAGRKWTLLWHSTDKFMPPARNELAAAVLVAGLLFAGFLYYLMSQLVRRKDIIAEEVDKQTKVIKEHVAQREELIEKLATSNEDLERFAYIASHDMQEPLRMVRSFTSLLEQQYADKLDDTAKQYIEFAHNSAGRMQDLVADLLEYARLNKREETVLEVDLNNVLGETLENLSERIEITEAKITYDDLPVVMASPIRMTSVMQNLISNAIKYQPEGNIPEIHIGAEEQGDFWRITVSDNGIGIAEEYRNKIFEPFQRLHGKHEYSGTGIGLPIVKRIIDGYGGEIWVDDLPDSRCVFCFTLPKHIKA